MSHTLMPTFYIPHGAGPCFFMDWQPAGTWDRMAHWIQDLENHAGGRPSALVVVSAHWEAPVVTVNTAATPGLLYDYYGFPEHTYHLEWPARGDPELADRILRLLDAAGLPSAGESGRGLDHGVFIPLKLAFPEADIPVVQVSLLDSLDPAVHIALGRALTPLRSEGVLIVGSGMSYHNMQRFQRHGGPVDPDSVRFDDWLAEVVAWPWAQREAVLTDWQNAPGARAAHPREEHLLPLHVVAGAAGDGRGERLLRDEVMGSVVSAFRFG